MTSSYPLDWSAAELLAAYRCRTLSPVGLTRSGLPVGLQIVAGRHRDALVPGAARELEGVFGFRAPPPGRRAA